MGDCMDSRNLSGSNQSRPCSPRTNFPIDEVDSCNVEVPAIIIMSEFDAKSENGKDFGPADCTESAESENEESQEERCRMRGEIAEMRTQLANHQTALQQKDNLLELHKKELALMENEKETLRREYETARREKEHAVVRYAMLEKTIIDANNAKDSSARKLKDAQREIETLTNRLKAVAGERDKSFKEVRDCIRENETLKYDLQACETKLKWNQVKLKQEFALKGELEKRLGDATQQLHQISGQRQHQIDSEKKVEREQGAQLIMLKHSVDEKDRNLSIAQKQLADLRSEFAELSERYEKLLIEYEAERRKSADLTEQLEKRVETIEFHEKVIEDNQNHLQNDARMRLEFEKEIANLTATIDGLKCVDENYKEQAEEMAILRSKEDDQLRLLRDLTEKCVVVENKLILANSKASALLLDNERLHKDNKARLKSVQDLEDELEKLKVKHNEEIKLFNRIVGDEKSRCKTLESQLDNVTGDLEATKNKHSQIVKELNRELLSRRENGAARRKSDAETADQEGAPVNGNSQQLDANGGPTKKALIDRIVKLQRQLAKQTEKIEFLENHCVALFNELKAKSN